jgi:TolB-like protein
MSSGSTSAVFLSYAREDTGVARRFADALRSHGVEVWFDQNELRGGDAWDQKIRRQIADCTLFIPIISKNTQERGKGYFRLEWKLAVEQTHLMAEGIAFLAPVAVDDTLESGALVPPEFMRVQWIRLPGALPTPQFVEQVKRLLEAPHKAAASDPGSASPPAGKVQQHAGPPAQTASASPPGRKAGLPGWAWAVFGILVVAGSAVLLSTRKAQPPKAVPAAAEIKPAVPEAPGAPAKSIAVLPFSNFSPDKDNEFFADGLHDEVITALAKIHDLKVISRTSVMAYKNEDGRNLRKIAAELGVATVLEGSVQRVGTKVHLNVQLIDARTDEHLWADSYTKDLTDVFSVQSDLAAAVTSALKATLSSEEKSLLVRRPTENQEAYDLFLRARILDQNLGPTASREDYERSISLYKQAAAKDPAFALPHVQASILHGTMYWFAVLDATPERRAMAQAEMETARLLAPGAPETLLAQGSFDYTCLNNWAKALAEYRAAEALLPNDAQVQYRIAMAHRRLGQWPEALERLERSAALNPNDYTEISQLLGTVFSLRRYPQLLELMERYRPIFSSGDRAMKSLSVRARYEIDGDRGAFLRAMADLPRWPGDANGLQTAYSMAILNGELDAADRVLADPRLKSITNSDGTISDPVDLHRALVSFLRGKPDEARRFADAAIAAYRAKTWAPRQETWVKMGIARAEAYAGRHDEANRDARAALDEELTRDAYSSLAMRVDYGQILAIGDRREEAFVVLRENVAQPFINLTPNTVRFDPVWSRLKDDPRFEEILRSAKPL